MLRVRILRNFTLEPIVTLLNRELAGAGLAATFEFGDYAGVAEEVAALSRTERFDLIVLALGLETSSPNFGHAGWDVGAACDRILLLARTAVRDSNGPLLLNLVLPPLYSASGGAAIPASRSTEAAIEALNLALRELAATDPARIALADWTVYARQLGEAGTYDQRFWRSSGAPFASKFLARYARDIAAVLRVNAGRVRKCLVLDCDNTLWGGVVGEDGIDGIRLSEDTLPGAYYRQFQRAVLDLHARGIAIALCSKNNEADVFEVLDRHPENLLRREHLSAWRINWDDKPVSIGAIADELNLGLDALVFVDDNPLECELVTRSLPQVRVLQVPSASSELVGFLERNNPFEALVVTDADRGRTTSYRQNRERRQYSELVGDLAQFKRELGTELHVREATATDLARVVQLLQRTNQFNLTTRRHDADAVKAMLSDARTRVLCAGLRDRFGDLGVVGVAIALQDHEGAQIDSLVLSCRALGRDAELAFACGIYRKLVGDWHVSWIEGEYVASDKNAQVSDFWIRAGLDSIAADGNRFRSSRNLMELAQNAPEHINLVVDR
jgi:FkbH-like protein